MNRFVKKISTKKNRSLIFRYILISLISYGFVFSGLIILIKYLNLDKSLAFLIVYGVNYIFLYAVQLKYLFKSRHNFSKLIRFIVFIGTFYLIANVLYNIILGFEVSYLIATLLTVLILMPLRIITSKFYVFKN